jgi:hypothetical protein
MTDEGKPRFFPKLPSQEIRYSGLFTGERFEGEWEKVITFDQESEDAFEYSGTGSWYMAKM